MQVSATLKNAPRELLVINSMKTQCLLRAPLAGNYSAGILCSRKKWVPWLPTTRSPVRKCSIRCGSFGRCVIFNGMDNRNGRWSSIIIVASVVGNIMDDWMDRGWAVIKVNLILGIAPPVLLLLYSQQFIRESRLIGAENEKRELFNRSSWLFLSLVAYHGVRKVDGLHRD